MSWSIATAKADAISAHRRFEFQRNVFPTT